MKNSAKVKICGIKRREDLLNAKTLGADYFGFILYEKSPRFISFEVLKPLLNDISLDRVVFVDVMPTKEKILQMQDFGCQNFQIHTHEKANLSDYEFYSKLIKKESLWLAPQLKDLNNFNESLLEFADNFLIDTYSKEQIGGTGKVGDWSAFKELSSKHPNKRWILAGGLNPENIKDAGTQSEAEVLDVSSGIEDAPGIKNKEALKRLFENIHS